MAMLFFEEPMQFEINLMEISNYLKTLNTKINTVKINNFFESIINNTQTLQILIIILIIINIIILISNFKMQEYQKRIFEKLYGFDNGIIIKNKNEEIEVEKNNPASLKETIEYIVAAVLVCIFIISLIIITGNK